MFLDAITFDAFISLKMCYHNASTMHQQCVNNVSIRYNIETIKVLLGKSKSIEISIHGDDGLMHQIILIQPQSSQAEQTSWCCGGAKDGLSHFSVHMAVQTPTISLNLHCRNTTAKFTTKTSSERK